LPFANSAMTAAHDVSSARIGVAEKRQQLTSRKFQYIQVLI